MGKTFSQRMGIRPVRSMFQIDNIDPHLRNCLWNELSNHYWSVFNTIDTHHVSAALRDHPMERTLFITLWKYYFKLPMDSIDAYWQPVLAEVRQYFFSCPWYEVYDFLEFVAQNYPLANISTEFMFSCNSVLQHELSAYRFVGGEIAPITSDEEIAEIEEAIEKSQNLTLHLQRALELLADRNTPDYRNSIKESISAVEGICQLITESPRATLGRALALLESKLGTIHPALKEAFNKLYGYTNDDQGIRHALLGESDLDIEDAKFMLIICSAFINYLVSKADKAGIKLTQV